MDDAAAIGMIIFMMVIIFGILGLMIAAMWKIYEKADKPGWGAIVPIYNIILQLEMVGRPVWWIALMMIPYVGIVFHIIVVVDLAKSFGKDAGYAIGMILLPVIFYPMLAWGDATYVGPGGRKVAVDGQQGSFDDEQF